MPTVDHPEFEILLEKRRRGALGPEEGAALERHLAECPSCRDFEAKIRRIDEALNRSATRHLPGVEWDRIARGARRSRGREIRVLVAILVLASFVGVKFTVAYGQGMPALFGASWVLPAAWAAILLGLGFEAWRTMRRPIPEGPDPEFLARYKRELDKFIGSNKSFAGSFLVIALIQLAILVWYLATEETGRSLRQWVPDVLFWTALAAYFFRLAKQAEKEHRELETAA